MLQKLSREARENPGLVGLAAAGVAKGAWEVYVRPEFTAKRAWIAIGAIAIAHEVACPTGQTLSEGVDKALERRRLLTTVAIGITALHLVNMLPERIDPYHQLTEVFKHGK